MQGKVSISVRTSKHRDQSQGVANQLSAVEWESLSKHQYVPLDFIAPVRAGKWDSQEEEEEEEKKKKKKIIYIIKQICVFVSLFPGCDSERPTLVSYSWSNPDLIHFLVKK